MDLRKRNRFLGGFSNRDYVSDYLDGQDDRFTPAINVAENDKTYKIEMGLPGFQKDDFQIDIERDCLYVKGVREKGDSYVKDEFTRQEFNIELFEKTFNLPANINQDRISAKFNEGFLVIELPKRDDQKKSGRKITLL